MGHEAPPGAIYRLLVTFEGPETVPDVFRFDRFEQAQGWVAPAVRRHAARGRIRAVALQRGTPISASGGDVRGPHPQAVPAYDWTIEKQWGADVVERILAQQARARQLPTTMPETFSRPAAVPWHRPSGLEPGRGLSPVVRLHKDTRWHMIGTFALVVLAILTTLLYQTGGNPHLLLAATKVPVETVKVELPFDARAGFVTVEPDAGRAAVHAAKFGGRPRPFGIRTDQPAPP